MIRFKLFTDTAGSLVNQYEIKLHEAKLCAEKDATIKGKSYWKKLL